jgi:flagellar motor protein MotB
MPRAQKPSESYLFSVRADWLPWFLSIFGAGCAVFVLVKGVLPARTENVHLMERVARLETAAQSASSERASLEQAKGHLLEQYSSAQAQLSSSKQARETALQARETARQDMSQTFAEQIAAGDLWLEQRSPAEGAASGGEGLVIGIRDRLLFNGDHAEVTWKGRRFLRALAENLKHLPADQLYEIGGHFDAGTSPSTNAKPATGRADRARAESKPRSSWEISSRRAASVARYLEEDGGIPGAQLIAAGFSSYRPGPDGSDAASRRIEVVLLAAPSCSPGAADAKMRSPL